MALVTERLKIVFVPHEERVPLVRLDVVDVCRQPNDPVLLAFNTERMRLKDSSAEALPLVAIASGGRRSLSLGSAPLPIGHKLRLSCFASDLVSFAILGAKRNRLPATWVLADG